MGTKRWVGATSGDLSTPANYAGGAKPVNGDTLLFDASATGDLTTGALGNTALQVNIGRGFSRSIGTASSAVTLQQRHLNQKTTIDMRQGFANLDLLTTDLVINSSPAGNSLYITGDVTTCTICGPTGNVTFSEDADLTTLVIAPNRDSGPDPTCQVTLESTNTISTLIIAGPCVIDCSTVAHTAICVGPGLRVDLRNDFGNTKLVVVRCNVKQHEKVPAMGGGASGLIVSNGSVSFADTVEIAAVGGGVGFTDLYPRSCLDLTNVPTLVDPGPITCYGGIVRPRLPVTMAVPSDTKLSSTSGRSLNFQLAANSGHVPTVLW